VKRPIRKLVAILLAVWLLPGVLAGKSAVVTGRGTSPGLFVESLSPQAEQAQPPQRCSLHSAGIRTLACGGGNT